MDKPRDEATGSEESDAPTRISLGFLLVLPHVLVVLMMIYLALGGE